MKRSIYKYQLKITDQQCLNLPIGAKILYIQNQNENLCLWALIDTEQLKAKTHTILCFGTGHPIPEQISIEFIGTVQFSYGSLVFHVFELIS